MVDETQTIAVKRSYEKYGSAQSRFVAPDEIPHRELVSMKLHEYATGYRQKYELTWNDYFLKKADKLDRQAVRYRYCGYEYVTLQCLDCGQPYLGASRCESRLCSHCSRKNGARVRSRQLTLVKRLRQDGTHRLAFLTLTKKVNPERPPNEFDIKAVTKAARKLINRYYPKKHGCGAFAVIEIGECNNIHIHALVYGPFIPQRSISKRWLKLTGDSQVVDIRAVRSPLKCVNYLLKYIGKPPHYSSPERYAEYIDSITGVRRIHTYGIFYNYPLMRKNACPCHFCGGKLRFTGTDGGLNIPLNAVLLSEVMSFENNN